MKFEGVTALGSRRTSRAERRWRGERHEWCEGFGVRCIRHGGGLARRCGARGGDPSCGWMSCIGKNWKRSFLIRVSTPRAFPRPLEYGSGSSRDPVAERDWDVIVSDFGELAARMGAWVAVTNAAVRLPSAARTLLPAPDGSGCLQIRWRRHRRNGAPPVRALCQDEPAFRVQAALRSPRLRRKETGR